MSLADYTFKLEDDLSDLLLDDDPTLKSENLPAVRQSSPASANQWDPRLILDIAVGIEDLDVILPRYGLSENDYVILCGSRLFRQELAMTIRDVHENGLPFRAKAKIQAESYLEVINDLIYDETTPATTKLEAIRSTVRWANLEPKDDKSDNGSNQTQVNVNISF